MLYVLQLDQLKSEKHKLHKEKVDLENQLEAEQVGARCAVLCRVVPCHTVLLFRAVLCHMFPFLDDMWLNPDDNYTKSPKRQHPLC